MAGELDKASGRVKEAAGDLTGDNDLKGQGAAEQAAGSVKDAGAKVGDKLKEAADSLGDKVKE